MTTASPTHTRPMLHGLKALAGAQSALPVRRTSLLAGGPVEYVVAGAGSPTVVLVGGFGVPIEGWALVLPELARTTTVVAYNRLGWGASAEPQGPQTGSAVVELLRELLVVAAAPAPYVLVGQGLGGLYANLFARRFADDVAGLVLLEPTHPADDVDERRLRLLPRSYRPAASRRGARRHYELHFLAETAAQMEQAGAFPDVPLTVVSGSRTPRRWAMSPEQVRRHATRQRELAGLSALGRHTVAPASGHFPQVTDPDVVVRAVREIVAA